MVAIIWNIWTHGNNFVFKNLVLDVEEVFDLTQIKTWAWITNRHNKAKFTCSDWCMNLVLCIKLVT